MLEYIPGENIKDTEKRFHAEAKELAKMCVENKIKEIVKEIKEDEK